MNNPIPRGMGLLSSWLSGAAGSLKVCHGIWATFVVVHGVPSAITICR